jgi:hypothetical protein
MGLREIHAECVKIPRLGVGFARGSLDFPRKTWLAPPLLKYLLETG